VLRLDRRLQFFDVPTQELLIRDRDEQADAAKHDGAVREKPLPLTFDVYVCWRIAAKTPADDPVDQFVRSFGTLEKAQGFLRSQIISRLKIEMSDVLLAQLVNTDRSQLKTAEMLRHLRTRQYPRVEGEPEQSLVERARQFGIEIVDIQLRRFNHPAPVRPEIFAKITEDRRREANTYRRQGEENAAGIEAEGKLEARRIRTDAEADKLRQEGQARAEATRILNEAHKEAPEFYRIVRLLESYKQMFADDKTQLILSLDHPLLSLFKELPRLNGAMPRTAGGTPPPAAATPGAGNGNGENR
jgi:HflC protein